MQWVQQVQTINELRFDSRKLAQEQQVLSGVFPIAGFSRLLDSLQRGDGTLSYRVEGARDQRQRPLLKLRVSGTLLLQCQRCLETLEYGVNVDTALRLVAQEALDTEYDDDPDEPDCVADSTAFDLAALIEDEVLLALPPYPRHEAGTCGAGAAGAGAGAHNDGNTAFSALQTLKQKLIQSKEQ